MEFIFRQQVSERSKITYDTSGVKLDSTLEHYYGEGSYDIYTFKYDGTGFLKEYYRTENGVNKSRVYYTDTAGFIKRVITRDNKFEYVYDGNNFLVSRMKLDTNNTILEVYNINYEIDSTGNWVLMEKLKNGTLISRIVREIYYFK